MSKQYILHYVRSTKNKHVYADREEIMGAIYVPKTELPAEAPATITMTLETK